MAPFFSAPPCMDCVAARFVIAVRPLRMLCWSKSIPILKPVAIHVHQRKFNVANDRLIAAFMPLAKMVQDCYTDF